MSVYGGIILDHFRNPRNRGEVEAATARAEAANPLCGDRIRISVRVVDGTVARARFAGDACAICTASASLLTLRVEGMASTSAREIAPESVVAALEVRIPDARLRCATLPLDALRRALVDPSPLTSVPAVVVAAGSARRFGGDKITAELRGEPIIRHVVRALIGRTSRIIVVAGDNADAIRGALAPLETPLEIVVNDRADEGMSGSIALGVSRCTGDDAALIVLGDQPGIDALVLDAVLGRWRAGGAEIVAPSFRGTRGHPVLFARSVFPELLVPRGDVGARAVVDRDPSRVAVVDVDAPPPFDVDTPDDLARISEPPEELLPPGA